MVEEKWESLYLKDANGEEVLIAQFIYYKYDITIVVMVEREDDFMDSQIEEALLELFDGVEHVEHAQFYGRYFVILTFSSPFTIH